MSPTDTQIGAILEPLFALSTGMSQVIADKSAVNRVAILQAIAHTARVRPSDIATALRVHQSQVTRQVQALEDENLVEVVRDDNDRRSYRITLTAAGQAEMRRLTDIGMAKWRRFLADWEEAEVDELGRLLSKLRSSITAVKAGNTRRSRQ
ncbi:MAG: MarR family transcriptional regulator [Kutzneria sp.]|nr:MarR family transcriptional regulator [Kutzneria sp.]